MVLILCFVGIFTSIGNVAVLTICFGIGFVAFNLSHMGYLYPGAWAPPNDDFMNYFKKKRVS